MQKLTESINAAPEIVAREDDAHSLTQAAADWASFSILNLDDPLLDKALAISTAIARFTTEMMRLHGKE